MSETKKKIQYFKHIEIQKYKLYINEEYLSLINNDDEYGICINYWFK